VRVAHPVTGRPVTVGWFRATEVEMFGPEQDRKDDAKGGRLLPNLGLSYGLVIGQQERKAIAMSILDSALQAAAGEEEGPAPSNDQEMVLSHVDGIESAGFVEHLKLPHYVTFGAAMRALARGNGDADGDTNGEADTDGDADGDG
jgi:alpha-D-ribose 1-methylphosphonate 5-triphosphate synthase subunit PhnI